MMSFDSESGILSLSSIGAMGLSAVIMLMPPLASVPRIAVGYFSEVRTQYMVAPRLKMSVRWSSGRRRTCSGAM